MRHHLIGPEVIRTRQIEPKGLDQVKTELTQREAGQKEQPIDDQEVLDDLWKHIEPSGLVVIIHLFRSVVLAALPTKGRCRVCPAGASHFRPWSS